jgi:hypothetical protein
MAAAHFFCKKIQVWAIAFFLMFWLWLECPIPNAQAAICRLFGNSQVCIIEIKRSAKYYWQYRVVLQIDGEQRPREIYNCRDRIRIASSGQFQKFQENGIGDLICNLWKR